MGSMKLINEKNQEKFYKLARKCGDDIYEIVDSTIIRDRPDRVLSHLQHRLNDYFCAKYHQSPLYHAALFELKSLFRLLILTGYDVNMLNYQGRTMLHQAVLEGEKRVVKFLLNNGARRDILSTKETTPLQSSLILGNTEIVKLFLFGGSQDINNISNIEIVNMLLTMSEEVIILESNFSTLLSFSSKLNDEEAFKLVLKNCSTSTINAEGPFEEPITILKLLLKLGNEKFLNHLIDHGADLHLRCKQGETPLVYAMKTNAEMVKFLLDKGVRLNDGKHADLTRIYTVAARLNDVNTLKLLVEYNMDLEAETHIGASIGLTAACKQYSLEVIKFLMEINVDLNREFVGNLPLEYACKNNQEIRGEGSRNPAEIIVAKIARMKAQEEFVCERNLRLINTWMKYFYKKCEVEISRMREKTICSSNKTCFYDFLINDIQKLAAVVRNKKVAKILKAKKYKKEFPIYGNDLEKQIEKAMWRTRTIRNTVEVFNDCVKCNLSDLIIYEVFKYLSEWDLKMLENALNCKIKKT